jgi:hypothetical protein
MMPKVGTWKVLRNVYVVIMKVIVVIVERFSRAREK